MAALILPDDLEARLRAAGAVDEDSLRAALERDPQLAADLQDFIEANPEAQAAMQMAALLQAFAAVQDADQLYAFWQQVPTELEQPFIELVKRALADAPADANPAALAAWRARLDDFRRLCDQARQELPPLLRAIQAFVRADTWAAAQRVVEEHPELLSDETLALFERLIAAAHTQVDADARRILVERRDLLRRCREVGAAQAFAEKKGSRTLFARSIPPPV